MWIQEVMLGSGGKQTDEAASETGKDAKRIVCWRTTKRMEWKHLMKLVRLGGLLVALLWRVG